MPTFNEVRTLGRLLDSLLASSLLPGTEWGTITVSDDGSTDGTDQVARARAKDDPRIVVISSGRGRVGKSGNLAYAQQFVAERLDAGEVVVVADADVEVDSAAIARLTRPLIEDSRVAVSSGASLPARRSWGRMASTFQMDVSFRANLRLRDARPNLDDRFFAYRNRCLGDFRWRANCRRSGDIQLAAYLDSHGLARIWVPTACVYVVPARGFREFHLQTYRNRAMVVAARRTGTVREQLFRAAVEESVRHPVRAVAYCVARFVAAGLDRVQPVEFSDLWDVLESTK